HVPFCKTKCPYCDFYSVTDETLISAYLGTLDTEARLYRDQFPVFDSLFLGGGTPSFLDAAQLGALVASLRRYFTFAAGSEITLEANPDDITTEKLRLFRDLGIHRLSLGVQSFDEAELRFLGRRHTAGQTLAAIDLIRAAGFTNLGLDLMYGLPGQTPGAWLKTLETALGFNPEHLSCYQLTITAGETPAPHETPALWTPMARRVARGEISLPDEETQREFFLLTANFLTGRGYLHYEISNFARQGTQAGSLCHYLCRHNLKYWTRTPYLGLGPGAHSFDSRRRWWNVSSVKEYCSSLNAGRPPVAEAETLTPEQIRLETLALGFRTREGVSLATIREHPNGDAKVAALTQAGLVRVDRGRVMATLDGLVVADRLPLEFA
ncbi:MAG: radical SAM family heme chaperone HemW, partial [Deltaproteobacteria bacterium]|nr:radical SAM family heme chaperone HemW [Deltaproteobacteria bacterium]